MAVALDTVSTVKEISGDGVVSLSHTAGGTTDRAIFVVTCGYGIGSGPATTGVTYGGTAMTNLWDVHTAVLSNLFSSGWYLPIGSSLTGAQTVIATLAASPLVQFLFVLSLTGVDQTTPVGTPQTQGPNGSATSATVTIASVGANDLVVDNVVVDYSVTTPTFTAGADQTDQASLSDGSVVGVASHLSTQPGSAGGVMSWSWAGGTTIDSYLGGIVFKAAAAGAGKPYAIYAQQQ